VHSGWRSWYYNGKSQSLTAWAAEYGIDYQTLCDRLKRGLTLHEALNVPRREDQPAQKCRGCRYLRRLEACNPGDCFCAYILIMKHKRPWPYATCQGEKTAKEKRK